MGSMSLTVTTVVGFVMHQSVGKYREDVIKLPNATALKVIGTREGKVIMYQ